MYELSDGKCIPLNYEDIVVAVFRKYPEDFHLRGYPEYPDATDINKPLYGSLKKKGFIVSGGKKFQLTELGLRIAKDLQGKLKTGRKRLPRDLEKEIYRIENSEGFRLFLEGKVEKLIDSDFYDYLGITVSTPKNIILGRLSLIKTAVETLADFNYDPLAKKIQEFHELMVTRFKKEIPKR